MNLYILYQKDNRGYDTYDSCVVAAENKEAARLITPGGDFNWGYSWANKPENVEVELIGKAAKGIEGLQISSFNAG